MRTAVQAAVFFLLVSPFLALAAEERAPSAPASGPAPTNETIAPAPLAAECAKSGGPIYEEKPGTPHEYVFPPSVTDFTDAAKLAKSLEAFNAQLRRAVGCANVCLNERVVVDIKQVQSGGQTYAVTHYILTTTNMCGTEQTKEAATKVNRGCEKGQNQPKVTIQYPPASGGDAETEEKSRCTANVIQMTGEARAASPGGPSNPEGAQTITLSNGQKVGADALSQTLKDFGISEEDAQAVVARNPQGAIALINVMQTGDAEKIRATAASLGITLNADTARDIASLTPRDREGKLAPLTADYRERNPQPVAITGFDGNPNQNPGTAPRNIVPAFAQMCANPGLGGCSMSCNRSTLTCRTNNPGALTCGGVHGVCNSIAARYGGFACGQNNNTACFPTVEQGIAAQAALLRGSRYFGSGNMTLHDAICRYSPNAAGNNCEQYTRTVSQLTGINPNQTVDPNNAQQIGSILMAMARVEGGSGVPYSPQQLQAGLEIAYGTRALPGGTPGYVPGMYSPNEIGTGITAASPFGETSSAHTLAQPLITNLFKLFQGGSQSGSGSTQQPSLTITSNKSSVAAGEAVQIVWLASGVKAQPLCAVFESGTSTPFAEGNSGSKYATTTSAMKGQQITFALKCYSLDNQQVERATSVIVQ